VVTNEGGPQHLVTPAIAGLVAQSDVDFVKQVVALCHNRERLSRMGVAARERVLGTSWDAAFEMTYAAYRRCLLNDEEELARTRNGSIGQA
jgi:glycosyltransferase involved in cell wall biosynthesis